MESHKMTAAPLAAIRDGTATLCVNPREGRHFIASRDLPAETVVCAAGASVVGLRDQYVRHVCAACFAIAFDAAPLAWTCERCDRVSYCSAKCRDSHITDHRRVCDGLRALGPLERQGLLIRPRMLLEIFAQRRCDAEFDALLKLARTRCVLSEDAPLTLVWKDAGCPVDAESWGEVRARYQAEQWIRPVLHLLLQV